MLQHVIKIRTKKIMYVFIITFSKTEIMKNSSNSSINGLIQLYFKSLLFVWYNWSYHIYNILIRKQKLKDYKFKKSIRMKDNIKFIVGRIYFISKKRKKKCERDKYPKT